jgi:hypothetical protein
VDFLWYKGITIILAVKIKIPNLSLGAYKYFLLSSNFYGMKPSIANATKIKGFQFPTHLLVILYIVVKIPVTHNNINATWQGKNPIDSRW